MPKIAKNVKRSKVHRSLVHHSHSGRLVHHRHTHYPIMLFLMLVTGVLLFAMTATTRAADIKVTATVLGDPPPYAAVITKPVNGDRFSQIPIDVEGTCPPSSIVKIYRNDVFSGSALCSGSNTFALQIDLFEGKNILIARVFNYAEVEGPVSAPVEVYYDKPAGAPPTTPPGKAPISQLFLDSDTLYRGFLTDEEITWPAEVGGGLPPYAVSVDWGDGSSDIISLSKAGKFDLKHTYSNPGKGYNGSYIIILRASDSQGAKAYLQIVIIVNDKKSATSTFATGRDDEGLLAFWQNLYHQLLLMWPFYIVALLMLFSFWLGERREYDLLTRRRRTRRAH